MTGLHRPDLEFAQVGDRPGVLLATMGGRLGARLIDLLIVFVPSYFPIRVFVEGTLTHALILLVTIALYEAITTARTGTSPGKRLVRIKIVRIRTGAPPGWGMALLRAVIMALSGWVISAVVAFFDERRHRGLHDRVSGTVVIAG
ncbi:RDD family protein [Actinocrispum sp. NPDC049592]|uniref:RDD family protein n=1 Tax=Actinocrispum sp. NPDC049592 TaxID=3154835 RepID=UPI00342E284C